MLRLRNRINIVKHRLRHILNYLGLLVNSADVIHEGLSFFLLYIVGRDTLGSVGYFRDPHKAQIIAHKMLGSLFEGVLQRWTSCEAVTFCLILQQILTNRPMLCEFSAHRLPEGFFLRTRWLKGRDQKSNKEPEIFLQCRHHSHQTRRVTARTKTRHSLLFTASLHNHGS